MAVSMAPLAPREWPSGLRRRDPGVRVDFGHSPGFGAVARDGAGTVRVDVADPLPFEPCVLHGELHGPRYAEALRVGVGYVVRVGGAPDALHLRVGLGAAALDGGGALEDHDRGALPIRNPLWPSS